MEKSRKKTKRERLIKPENLFVLIALFFGIICMLAMPASTSWDEQNHIARTVQVSQGEIFSEHIGKKASDYGGKIDSGMIEFFAAADKAYLTSQRPSHFIFFPAWEGAGISQSKHMEKYDFANTAVYSPINYLPQAIGYKIVKIVTPNIYTQILAMRFFALITFVLALFFIIKFVPIMKWLFFTVALMPITLWQACMVTADTMTIIGCFAFVAYVLYLTTASKLKKSNYLILLILGILIPLLKMTYSPILLFVLILPILNRSWCSKKNLLYLLGVLIIGGIVGLFWYKSVNGIYTGGQFGREINPNGQLHFVLSNPLHFLKILIKQMRIANPFITGLAPAPFFNAGVMLPFIPIGLCLSLGLSDKREVMIETRKSQKVSIMLINWFIYLGTMSLIYLALYLQFNSVASPQIDGIQDRYFLPILPFLIIPFFFFVRDKFSLRSRNSLLVVVLLSLVATLTLFL